MQLSLKIQAGLDVIVSLVSGAEVMLSEDVFSFTLDGLWFYAVFRFRDAQNVSVVVLRTQV